MALATVETNQNKAATPSSGVVVPDLTRDRAAVGEALGKIELGVKTGTNVDSVLRLPKGLSFSADGAKELKVSALSADGPPVTGVEFDQKNTRFVDGKAIVPIRTLDKDGKRDEGQIVLQKQDNGKFVPTQVTFGVINHEPALDASGQIAPKTFAIKEVPLETLVLPGRAPGGTTGSIEPAAQSANHKTIMDNWGNASPEQLADTRKAILKSLGASDSCNIAILSSTTKNGQPVYEGRAFIPMAMGDATLPITMTIKPDGTIESQIAGGKIQPKDLMKLADQLDKADAAYLKEHPTAKIEGKGFTNDGRPLFVASVPKTPSLLDSVLGRKPAGSDWTVLEIENGSAVPVHPTKQTSSMLNCYGGAPPTRIITGTTPDQVAVTYEFAAPGTRFDKMGQFPDQPITQKVDDLTKSVLDPSKYYTR